MIETGLQDKVVLVTGANHGIGAATAEAFAAQGAAVLIHYRRLLTPSDAPPVGAGATALPGEALYRTRQAQSADHINIVSPGPIQTGWIAPDLEERCRADTPLRRVGQPHDIADVIVFLASEQARWLTGQLLYAGGGHTM